MDDLWSCVFVLLSSCFFLSGFFFCSSVMVLSFFIHFWYVLSLWCPLINFWKKFWSSWKCSTVFFCLVLGISYSLIGICPWYKCDVHISFKSLSFSHIFFFNLQALNFYLLLSAYFNGFLCQNMPFVIISPDMIDWLFFLNNA